MNFFTDAVCFSKSRYTKYEPIRPHNKNAKYDRIELAFKVVALSDPKCCSNFIIGTCTRYKVYENVANRVPALFNFLVKVVLGFAHIIC